MGLYKICEHRGRARDRCEHAWWGSFQYQGHLYRESLQRWGCREVGTKLHALGVLDEMRKAIREGTFKPSGKIADETGPLTFDKFSEKYIEKYVQARQLASADTIEYRMAPIRSYFGPKLLADIKTADIEDFVAELKKPCKLAKDRKTERVRRPATINRYLSLLRHMFNWAEGREYLVRTPFRRGTQNLVPREQEDNQRHRRLSLEEEQKLLEVAAEHIRPMLIAALDCGLRRGEMLEVTWADVDARPGWLRLRGETTKSGRTRWVPIGTTRLQAVLEYLRLDADGEKKPATTVIFSNEAGEPLRWCERPWHNARGAAGLTDFRWHDLRHEYASRLVEKGVPLSQVRDLLGHASIVTTERYDNQRPEALQEAAKLLDTGESFKIPSRSDAKPPAADTPALDEADAKLLQELEEEGGVGNGVRTRDFRSHSPALYH